MTLTANTKQLLEILKNLSKITSKVPCNYDCAGKVCITVSDGMAEFRANDGTTDFTWILIPSSSEDGKAITPVMLLTEMVESIDDEILTLSDATQMGERYLTLTWKEGHCRLPLMESVFPEQEDLSSNFQERVSFRGPSLLRALNDNSYATASSTGQNPILECVNVSVADGKIESAATDCHILSYTSEKPEGDESVTGESNVNIPSKFVPIITSMLKKQGGAVMMTERNRVLISCGTAQLTFSTTENRYPNWKPMIPQETGNHFKVDRELLLSVTKRLSIVERKAVINIKAEPGALQNITLSSGTPTAARTVETLDCEYEGESMEILFPANKLSAALEGTKGKMIDIYMQSPRHPALIKPCGQSSSSTGVIVMPCAK